MSSATAAIELLGPVRIHLQTAESVLKFGHIGQARPSLICAALLLCEASGLDEVGLSAVRRLLNGEVNGHDYDSAADRGFVITESERLFDHERQQEEAV